MIARIWRATYHEDRLGALREFATEVSTPYLTAQPGNAGLWYLCRDGVWLTVTFWTDAAACRAMEAREDYREISRGIEATGAIIEVVSVEVFDVQPTGRAGGCPGPVRFPDAAHAGHRPSPDRD